LFAAFGGLALHSFAGYFLKISFLYLQRFYVAYINWDYLGSIQNRLLRTCLLGASFYLAFHFFKETLFLTIIPFYILWEWANATTVTEKSRQLTQLRIFIFCAGVISISFYPVAPSWVYTIIPFYIFFEFTLAAFQRKTNVLSIAEKVFFTGALLGSYYLVFNNKGLFGLMLLYVIWELFRFRSSTVSNESRIYPLIFILPLCLPFLEMLFPISVWQYPVALYVFYRLIHFLPTFSFLQASSKVPSSFIPVVARIFERVIIVVAGYFLVQFYFNAHYLFDTVIAYVFWELFTLVYRVIFLRGLGKAWSIESGEQKRLSTFRLAMAIILGPIIVLSIKSTDPIPTFVFIALVELVLLFSLFKIFPKIEWPRLNFKKWIGYVRYSPINDSRENDQVTPVVKEAVPSTTIPWTKIRGVAFVGTFLVVVNGIFGFWGINSWPFSSYPSYSTIIKNEISIISFVGKNDDGSEVNIDSLGLKADFRKENIRPFENSITILYEKHRGNAEDSILLKKRIEDYWELWRLNLPELEDLKSVQVYLNKTPLAPEERHVLIEHILLHTIRNE
jgi:hypothetical protein